MPPGKELVTVMAHTLDGPLMHANLRNWPYLQICHQLLIHWSTHVQVRESDQEQTCKEADPQIYQKSSTGRLCQRIMTCLWGKRLLAGCGRLQDYVAFWPVC